MSRHNAKALLTELLQFYVSLPASREKHELDRIITMLKLGHSDLKTILQTIQGNAKNSKKDIEIQLWGYVLSIFTKYARSK